jgi:hypothetical protein
MTGQNLALLANAEQGSKRRFAREKRRRFIKYAGLISILLAAGGIGLKVIEATFGSLFEIGHRTEQRQAIALLDPVGYAWTRQWSSNDLRLLLYMSRGSFELTRALAQIPDRQSPWISVWFDKPVIGREEAIAMTIRTIAVTPIDRRADAINWIGRMMSASGLAQDSLYWLATLHDRQLRNLGDPQGPLLGTATGRAVLLAASEMTSAQLNQCKAAAAMSESDWAWATWAAHLSGDDRERIIAARPRR